MTIQLPEAEIYKDFEKMYKATGDKTFLLPPPSGQMSANERAANKKKNTRNDGR